MNLLELASTRIEIPDVPTLTKLWSILDQNGIEARIVGGAVRDLLLQREYRDIDLVTDMVPDGIIHVLQQNEYEDIDTWGIDHGTVKVEMGSDEYEITSLDYHIKMLPRGMRVTYNPDWRADARARDFTINALSADRSGYVHDYVNGISDLRNQRVRMIGDPDQRIQENPRLLVRFFKALGVFDEPRVDAELVRAVRKNAELVDQLEPDWIEKVTGSMGKTDRGKIARKKMKLILGV